MALGGGINKISKCILFLLITTLILACPSDVVSEPDLSGLTQNDEITGLWLENWYWSTENDMNVPSSYAFLGDVQDETFCLFNADGTGVYFNRVIKIEGLISTNETNNLDEIILNNDPVPYEVVMSVDGEYINTDSLNWSRKIFWGVDSSNNLVVYREDSTGDFIKIETTYTVSDKANDFTFLTVDKLHQEKDLIAETFGEFGRIPDSEKDAFLNNYF